MTTETDRIAIRALIEDLHKACHKKDAAAVVARYAPDAVVFDLAPPLVSATGTDAGKLQAWFDGWDGPVDRLTQNLAITVDGDLAFCHALFRTSATTRSGEHAVYWDPRHPVPQARRQRLDDRPRARVGPLLYGRQLPRGRRSPTVIGGES